MIGPNSFYGKVTKVAFDLFCDKQNSLDRQFFGKPYKVSFPPLLHFAPSCFCLGEFAVRTCVWGLRWDWWEDSLRWCSAASWSFWAWPHRLSLRSLLHNFGRINLPENPNYWLSDYTCCWECRTLRDSHASWHCCGLTYFFATSYLYFSVRDRLSLQHEQSRSALRSLSGRNHLSFCFAINL